MKINVEISEGEKLDSNGLFEHYTLKTIVLKNGDLLVIVYSGTNLSASYNFRVGTVWKAGLDQFYKLPKGSRIIIEQD